LKKREGEAPERILLYVDQGEELYTRAARKDAKRFSEVLAEGLGDPRLRIFASMRSDYFGRLQADGALFKRHEHVDVPPLDHTQLHELVTAPARALGVDFEDDQTANRITTAAAEEPGALPLLSYLLTDMWSGMVRRGDATLRLPAQVIDVGGVLASRAEEFLKGNPNEEKSLRRLLTLKLASVPPEGEPVRRQTTDEECTDAEWALARRLAEHPWRLVVIGERAADRRIVAEVAHEAMLRAWPRLADWLRNERDFLIFKGDAERAERRWRGMGGDVSALLTGLDLTRAEGWLPSRSEDLSREVVAFAQRSIAADRAAKEWQIRFQRGVSIAAVLAALFMAGVGGFAWLQWEESDRQRKQADDILQGATTIIKDSMERNTQKEVFREQVFRMLKMGADRGNVVSMSGLGWFYTSGFGVAQDYTKARFWYEKAAAKGDAHAMAGLGWLYGTGSGGAQDHAKARDLLEKAADKGYVMGMTILGENYANAQDHAKARDLFEKAADKGDARAMANLGRQYEEGLGVPQDYAKAREWYEKAAAKGDARFGMALEQLAIHEAETTGRYAEALRLGEALVAKVEAVETQRDGKPGKETAEALAEVAWVALLARDFTKALIAAERGHALQPDFAFESNRAHALMFMERGDEAKALYFAHKGTRLPEVNQLWEQAVAEDFAKLRNAGLTHPMMADIEKELGISPNGNSDIGQR
jgi:TPR repeat protein